MTTAVQHRRGTTAEHSTFTGLEGEVTIDTTKDTAVIHDGSLAGGYPLAKETLANVNPSTLSAITGAATASDDLFLMYDTSALAMKKISRAELNNAITIEALDTVDINGGTIDGTTIGGTTPAAGSFTTLSASGNVTLSGGTANGVAYLNGSKVLTSGSALTFDGTSVFAAPRVRLNNANRLDWGDQGEWIVGDNGGAMLFGVDTSEQMRLTSTGLGIGRSSPGYKLDVAGRISYNGAIGEGADTTLSSISTTLILGASSTWTVLNLRTGGTTRLAIDSSGNVGIGTSSPGDKIELGGDGSGIIIRSPNGTRYRLTVTDLGVLSIAAA